MSWDEADLAALDRAREVAIETCRPDDTRHRTTIWAMVDGDEVYVRSVRGDRGIWWQSAVDRPTDVALILGGRRLEVTATLATDDLSIARCSSAVERKYAREPELESMLREDVLGTTLRLEPQ